MAHYKRAWWNLAECIAWVWTRDFEHVDTLRRIDADEALTYVMMRYKIGVCLTPAPLPSSADAELVGPIQADESAETPASRESEAADPTASAESPEKQPADREARAPGEPTSVESPPLVAPVVPDGLYLEAPSDPITAVIDEVRNGRLEMRGRRVDGTASERIEPVEFADLTFRIVPGHPKATIGLWMSAVRNMVWTSLQCPSASVMQLWPAPRSKTADVQLAILKHLNSICKPGALLTRTAAYESCVAKVKNFYPQAFKDAWRELDPSLKKRRGEHGPRIHSTSGKRRTKPPAS